MSDLKLQNDAEVISLYYNSATSGIKESWFAYSHKENWYNYINELPEKEKTTYLIYILDYQVCNGGFDQYFFNGYGQFVKDTIPALKIINAFKTAEVVEKAFWAINNNEYDDKTFRKKILLREIEEMYADDNKLTDYLDKLDDKYYECVWNIEDIEQLLANYLRA